MASILSKIAGGANQIAGEVLRPTSLLGQLGMYLGAASGNPLGSAALAAKKDDLAQGDVDLDRQYKQAQIAHLTNPEPKNDTERDYLLYAEKFGPDFANKWLRDQTDKPVAVQQVDPDTGEARTYFVRPSQIGGLPGAMPPKPATEAPDFLPKDFNFGGPTQPASGGFR